MIEPNQNTPPVNPAPTSAVEEKPKYTIHNILALAYVLTILVVFSTRFSESIDNALALPVLIIGIVAAIGFVARIGKLTATKDRSVRVFSMLGAVGGGIVIFIVGAFAALLQGLKHIHGD